LAFSLLFGNEGGAPTLRKDTPTLPQGVGGLGRWRRALAKSVFVFVGEERFCFFITPKYHGLVLAKTKMDERFKGWGLV
jgi:hypothetical protein